MSVFDHPEFDDHERVVHFQDAETGLRAIVAIHDTTLGPALGGVRMFAYADGAEALRDVLRLSRGMTYKSALAGLALGGGKSVIVGDPISDKSEALMRAMGRCVDELGGRYIAAEDSGTGIEDLRIMAGVTEHVSGIADKTTTDGGVRSGDPSPATARGCFIGIRAAVHHALGRDDLDGVRIAVQGLGHVGGRLARLLAGAGATLVVTDRFPENVEKVAAATGATGVSPDEIFGADVDVFAPCALGAVLNERTIPMLQAKVVAGAANNQLAEAAHGRALTRRGILYAPDYVINAGGVIDVAHEREGFRVDEVAAHIDRIGDTLTEIFERADAENRPTSDVADDLARERLAKAREKLRQAA